MISYLIYVKEKNEIVPIKKLSLDVCSRVGDDDWDVIGFSDYKKFIEYLNNNPKIDISCIDITNENGVATAENVRAQNDNTYIILIADITISPASYIKPTIMAGSLLLRPLNRDNTKNVLLQAFNYYLKRFRNEDGSKNFVIESRGGRELVPYEKIMFFESREKKIFLNTKCFEYSFYDTLDNLETKLTNAFVRCHRSFIVSKSHIKNIKLSQNIIILDNDYQVPLSRSYKSVIKELK